MAAASIADRSITSIGQAKMEYVYIAEAANGDTVKSQLNTPEFAIAISNATGNGVSTAISSRQVTIHDPGDSPTILLVFGS